MTEIHARKTRGRAPARSAAAAAGPLERPVRIPVGPLEIEADLVVPEAARGLVLFAHGSGSSRRSPRNRAVSHILQEGGFATLLVDLLTRDEEAVDVRTRQLRFDIGLLAGRIAAVTEWIAAGSVSGLPLGYFGASTGAVAALVAAAERPEVRAVVSRGGRPDLAGRALGRVRAPTLLVVGGCDALVLELNRDALERLAGERALEIVPGATHLFEEPGALERVAELALGWFARWLPRSGGAR